jgi:hypothetical protein
MLRKGQRDLRAASLDSQGRIALMHKVGKRVSPIACYHKPYLMAGSSRLIYNFLAELAPFSGHCAHLLHCPLPSNNA